MEAIREATEALGQVEDNPPVVPDAGPPAKFVPKARAKPELEPEPSEPTIDIPLKKGTKMVPISHLRIISGETDAATYRQAVLIAGRLIDGKLWNGESAILLGDVYALAKKPKHLSDKDLSLFTLEDFTQFSPSADSHRTD